MLGCFCAKQVAAKSAGHEAETESCVLQIASTWEGIRACEILQKQGIDTNMTLLFSFAQVQPCRPALQSTVSRQQAGPCSRWAC